MTTDEGASAAGHDESQITEQVWSADLAPPADAALVFTRTVAGRRSASDDDRTDHADAAGKPEREKQRASWHHRRHAFRAYPARETAEGSRCRDARHQRLRRVRIDVFVEE
jgi:hypothetical protein